MKILMIMTSNFHQSGITNVVLNYYHSLIENYDCEVDFVIPNKIDEKFIKNNRLENAHFFVMPRKMRILCTPLYIRKLKKIIKKGQYDVVHAHGSSSLLFFELYSAKLAGVKVRIAHSHSVKTEHPFFHKLLTKPFMKVYTKAIACSVEAGNWLFKNKNFEIITNGFDIKRFKYDENSRKKIRDKYSVKDNEVLLGHVGLFNETKNQIFLVKILNNLCKKNKNYKLLLVGDGILKENVIKYVDEKGLKDKVIFFGTTNKPEDVYSAMDIFLLPSKFEGLGIVAVEAQISGLPCIISNSVPHIVAINKNVRFLNIENSDIPLWCDNIEKIDKDDLRENNDISIYKEYDIDNCHSKLHKIYVEELKK